MNLWSPVMATQGHRAWVRKTQLLTPNSSCGKQVPCGWGPCHIHPQRALHALGSVEPSRAVWLAENHSLLFNHCSPGVVGAGTPLFLCFCPLCFYTTSRESAHSALCPSDFLLQSLTISHGPPASCFHQSLRRCPGIGTPWLFVWFLKHCLFSYFPFLITGVHETISVRETNEILVLVSFFW